MQADATRMHVTRGSSRGGEGAEQLGGLAGEAGEAQEDLKGEESEVAVESSPLIGSSLIGKRSH